MPIFYALMLGVISGARSMLGPALVSWAAWLGILNVAGTPLAFMGYRYTHLIWTVLIIGELIVDKLPATPSRKAPGPFIGRLVTGGLSGATIGAAAHSIPFAAFAGVMGAIIGTVGGHAVRRKLAAVFHRDLPAAVLEDMVAIGLGVLCLFVPR